MARKLNVLNINDKATGYLSEPSLLKWLNIVDVGTVDSVQEQMLKAPNSNMDIFLIDVDMSGNDHPKGLVWGSETFRLYGPLLAVPFLTGSEISTFTPYSSFWGKADVQKNGFLLVALSLILCKVERVVYNLSDTKDYVVSLDRAQEDLAQSPKEALATGLARYRKTLFEFSGLEFIDLDRTIDRLAALERASQGQIEIPFKDDEGYVDVAFCYPPAVEASISLSSLFADLMNFREPVPCDKLTPIYQALETLKNAKGTSVRLGNALFDSVVEALDVCRSDEKKMRFHHAIGKASIVVHRKVSKHRFARLGMLFAWVEAWHDPPKKRTKTEEMRKMGMIESVHNILGFRTTGAGNEYRRLLCPDNKTPLEAGEASGDQKPFRDNFDIKKPNTAYQLDTLGVEIEVTDGSLTSDEKCLCIRYAKEILDWDPQNNPASKPYPRWMR